MQKLLCYSWILNEFTKYFKLDKIVTDDKFSMLNDFPRIVVNYLVYLLQDDVIWLFEL